MSANSRNDHFFIYPRFEHGDLTGHTYCVLLRDGRMYEGSALCSINDNFEKKRGRALAFQRAILEYERDCSHKGIVPLNVHNPYLERL